MARYIHLLNWTDKGVQQFKDTMDRGEAARKVAADMGGSIELYWTMGEYDLVAISEFPDDETVTSYLLKVASLGNVRTRTMRAFDSNEIEGIVGAAG